MVRKFITKKQRNLLLLSESIKNPSFKDLYNYLKSNDIITYQNIRVNKRLKNITTFIDDLLLESRLEWEVYKEKPIHDLGVKFEKFNSRCELCGKRPIRYEYAIQNKYNKNRIVIGSECTKEFHNEILVHLKQSKKRRKSSIKRKELEEQFPGIREMVENGLQYTKSSLVILPLEMETSWQNEIKKLIIAYNDYITNVTITTNRIQSHWENLKSIKSRIIKYTIKIENSKYIASKKVVDWLYKNDKKNVIRMIQGDGGVITTRTLYQIHEPEMMSNVFNYIRNKIQEINRNILLKKINTRTRDISVEIKVKNLILHVKIKYDYIVQEWGELYFGKSKNIKINTKEFLDKTKLDLSTKIRLLQSVGRKYKIGHRTYVMKGFFPESNEVVYKCGSRWFVLNSTATLNYLKKNLFKNPKFIKDFSRSSLIFMKESLDEESIKEYFNLKKLLGIDNYYE